MSESDRGWQGESRPVPLIPGPSTDLGEATVDQQRTEAHETSCRGPWSFVRSLPKSLTTNDECDRPLSGRLRPGRGRGCGDRRGDRAVHRLRRSFLQCLLGFVFGFALGLIPLLRAGFSWSWAIRQVLVAEGLSIAIMETAEVLVWR